MWDQTALGTRRTRLTFCPFRTFHDVAVCDDVNDQECLGPFGFQPVDQITGKQVDCFNGEQLAQTFAKVVKLLAQQFAQGFSSTAQGKKTCSVYINANHNFITLNALDLAETDSLSELLRTLDGVEDYNAGCFFGDQAIVGVLRVINE